MTNGWSDTFELKMVLAPFTDVAAENLSWRLTKVVVVAAPVFIILRLQLVLARLLKQNVHTLLN